MTPKPLTSEQAYFILGIGLSIASAGIVLFAALMAVSIAAEAALPVVDHILDWGG